MKVAYIYTAILEYGGVDRILTQKANYLADKLGHQVYIITDSQAGKPTSFPLSLKVHHIDLNVDFDEQYHHCLPFRAYFYFTLMHRYRKRLTAKLMEIQPDITITMLGRDMDFLTNIHDGSKKIGESHVVKQYCRNFHLLEQKGWLQRQVAHYWRKKQERAVAKLNALVLLTKHDMESWADVKKGIVIPNSIANFPKESASLTNKRCIYVARYVDDKGYKYLFNAWKEVNKNHPDWTLHCFGQGDRSNYQQIVNEDNLQDVIILHGATKEIQIEYLKSSIFIMPSLFEGFGLVLIEAMACGVPCVSFNCPYGPLNIISNGKDGILVKYLDINELSEKICFLIENESIRKEMGANAKKDVIKYNEENIMKCWNKLFLELSK